MSGIQKIGNIGKSDKELQSQITVTEVWHLWQNLVQKYDLIELIQILHNYADDTDLRAVIKQGMKWLQQEVKMTENEMERFGINVPKGAPAFSRSTIDVEAITDSFIFRRVFFGIQATLPSRMQAFIDSTSPQLREIFRVHMEKDIEIYDLYVEYGKLKEYLDVPPAYRL